MQWIVIILLILFIYYFFIRKGTLTQTLKKREKGEVKKSSDVMLECEKCGVYVSDKEAIIVDGRFYCSKECAGVK
ncbi:PP0621 family protein [Wolinella succinogenes]|uniref:Prokaryotic metallothionein n=1 Tax=Wolinella succinogenes (strain ATCC 29543 / DSM 1740 / CCUG 13145 / JCM 31913 / LMG 7466 / NCTC 11488 / FDC 602W) TaxID=273121 RepID=Q7MS18_WOLSU|nr:PP0621 family protein [Wolinella succinogenes]NLU35243.1 hypothetical protein [Wolinella succinogenes]CAE09975.1 hypothetical protein WS0866 [Wolinella succinogenes]VEG82187.1 Prokaryotic metallothionein [Wolinella succinogenes]HCZ19465.1 hypothetical protein [Helicobacter sp.]